MLGSNMVLPVPNPTGSPFEHPPSLAKFNDERELKGLSVKAELHKLGAPSRSFSEYLLLDPNEGKNDMEDCQTLGGQRPSICDRFTRIERARPAVHPVTINLAKRLKKA